MVEVVEFLKNISFSISLEDITSVLQLIVILAVATFFIWEFYKSISKRNLIKLNLNKYNRTNHPLGYKLLAIFMYFLEFLVIMPVLIILWFAALSLVLLMIVEGTNVQETLLLAAAIVGASRVLAYFRSEIARELAKLIPFVALSVYVLTLGNRFSIPDFLLKLKEIPLLLNDIFSFILAILIAEVFLRFIFTLAELWVSEEKAINSDPE